ncbi:FG-GAP-like repeat-containing protein [Fodinibius salsisoli]|uniref:VCBS repeat-containing protein n=1 Tax=Fodinibius salsisoli TaxID=2820877 RepID=A0ABT3PK98_9BACT|nr:FG-GAP-like repeat-containing protein [Fodinibius salsisoli]MCW9706365.1 VCBS repeat-containing protein [Fodinibius salsisoli]
MQCVSNTFWLALLIGVMMVAGCTSSPELQWHQEEHYRWAEVSPGYFGETGFESLDASRTNISFKNSITDQKIAENRVYLNGSGLATGDVDGDGLVDLYFAGLDTPNKLYKNTGGLQFRDITEQAGVAHEGYHSTGAVFADIDGDEDLDLLVTSINKQNALYINDGAGNFKRKENSGLGSAQGSMTMALADIDGDQDLDLYITNYKAKSVKDIYSAEELDWDNLLNEPYNEQDPEGPFTLAPPFDEHYQLFMTEDNRLAGLGEVGEEDELYINEDGFFRKVEDTAKRFLDTNGNPLGLQPGWGLTAKFQDLNDDGLPDLYVCNDFFPKDKIWINQGEGIFREMHWSHIRNMSFASMAVDFSDVNKDDKLDIFVTEMLSPVHDRRLRQSKSLNDPRPEHVQTIQAQPQYNRNSLYLQREDHTYAEAAHYSQTAATEWSWATRFMDINLDGYEDLIVNTGYTYDILDIDTQAGMIQEGRNMDEDYGEFVKRAPSLALPNKFLMNNGKLKFKDQSKQWGFTEEDVSHGLATADLDNDGDLDFASNRLNSTGTVFENMSNAPRIAVRLHGEAANRQGIGAKISLKGGDVPQKKEITAGGDYLSGSTPTVMFAADKEKKYTIKVTWPSGSISEIEEVKSNRIYEINKSGAAENKMEDTFATDQSPVFTDVSQRINHKHHEKTFDESKLQPLLPTKLSQLGPGISWVDLDQDNDDDLLVAAGNGSSMGAFENIEGSFETMKQFPFESKVQGDQTAVIGWETEQGTNMIVGSANYEQNPQVPSAFQYRFSNGKGKEISSFKNYSTTGPVAAADYDQDGDIDLFLGGQFVPAHYPRDATSRLFLNENGSFVVDKINSRKLGELGLVTGAVFSDYDQDGDQDLLMSRSWDSIILMENEEGVFNDVTDQVGLNTYKGLWNSIATGDFNSDGKPDIIAANWGENSSYSIKDNATARMYYDDFNGDRRVDIIEAKVDESGSYVPTNKLFDYNSIPLISNQFNSFNAFAQATMQDIFGDNLSRIAFKEVNTFQHMLFTNTGEGFKADPLPKEAQFSTGFHLGVADFNNDGSEDLFMSQNFFGLPRDVPRLDSGRGLWLRGDGSGNLSSVSGSKSGIKIYGEQRGAAFSDFNKDGKVDLAVSQNNAQTKLYLNDTKRKGYRVSLQGPPQNRNGIGSSVQLIYANGKKGPLREIQAGSGYWSQNSYTQILGAPADREVSAIEVHWFNNETQIVDIKNGLKSYLIQYSEQ